ncbi:MAG: tetratricopeptide repeat protein [Chloroflexi bacterium]|nr:tetratricopeptide repeat protein [Chloroflexota bacterium]
MATRQLSRSARPAGWIVPRRARATLIALGAAAVTIVAITAPTAFVLSILRVDPVEVPAALERLLDGRTDGEKAVAFAQRRLAAAPDDPLALAGLASAFLLRQRESADPIYFSKAAALVERATAREVRQADVAITAAAVANAAHDFATGLRWADLALRLAPGRASTYGVLTDALVELGRYDDAVAAAQRMVDLRPDLASLARVSYLRELQGDVDGAIAAMRRAVAAGSPRTEATAWTEVQLGHLLFARGDLTAAEAAYQSALQRVDGFVYAVAGIARVRAAQGDDAQAIALYEKAVARLPTPELVAALGDLRLVAGDAAGAESQYALVAAMDRLLVANGVRTDLDIALFWSDRAREPERALAAARGEYARRPASVHAALALAWAEYRTGDLASARSHSEESLRLGTRDPLFLYRAGVIAQEAGDLERARDLLGRSAAANARASVLFADDLGRRLGQLRLAQP